MCERSAREAAGGRSAAPQVFIATREAATRCAACRAYRRASLGGQNFRLYWCGRCPSRLVLRRQSVGGRASSSTHRVTRHARDGRLHLFETDAGTLLIFLQTDAAGT